MFLFCTSAAISELLYNDNLASFVVERHHIHLPNHELAIRKPIIERIIQAIILTAESTRNVIYSTIRGISGGVIRAVGSFEHISRVLKHTREKYHNPTSYFSGALRLSEWLLKTHTDSRFYQYGPENYGVQDVKSVVILFYSYETLKNLRDDSLRGADGTFAVMSEPWRQLYTISYIGDHHVFPVVFSLLNNKSLDTYRSLFRIIESSISKLKSVTLKPDFEYAAITVYQETFPARRISGCLYHFSLAIDRKIKVSGFSSIYSCNYTVRKCTSALRTLVSADFDEIHESFTDLKSSSYFPECLYVVYDYFLDTH